MKVLLVEDDDGVASAMEELLAQAGASVTRCARGADGVNSVVGHDIVILDLGLPDMDGLDVLRVIRKASTVPVIVMTARDSDGAVVLGLRLGADDYLVKPVSKPVLLARIQAVLRRTRESETPAAAAVVRAGSVLVDFERREVRVDDDPVALTRTEFDIVNLLARRLGEAVSREELTLEVWGTPDLGRSRSLDFFISQLRGKLGDGFPLETVRGYGFKLAG